MKTNLRLIGGRRLECPNTFETRPTTLMVREAIFNILLKIFAVLVETVIKIFVIFIFNIVLIH